jgi:glycine/D-amino acid oxidase-like deaminating enzyme
MDQDSEQAAQAPASSIRLEVYWIADGEETTPIPAEIKRVLDEQKEKLDITQPALLARASIAAYVDGSGPPISLHGIQAHNGSHLDCDALVEALGNGAFRLQLRLVAGTDSKTSIDTSIRTTLGHPLFVASTTTSGQTEKPTVFVVRITE